MFLEIKDKFQKLIITVQSRLHRHSITSHVHNLSHILLFLGTFLFPEHFLLPSLVLFLPWCIHRPPPLSIPGSGADSTTIAILPRMKNTTLLHTRHADNRRYYTFRDTANVRFNHHRVSSQNFMGDTNNLGNATIFLKQSSMTLRHQSMISLKNRRSILCNIQA